MDISVFADSPTIDILPNGTGAELRIWNKEIAFTIYVSDVAAFKVAIRKAVPGVLLRFGTDYTLPATSAMFVYSGTWECPQEGWIVSDDISIKIDGDVTMTTWI